MKKLIFTLIVLFVGMNFADAQRTRKRAPKKIVKRTLIELESGVNKYPVSYFGGLRKDSLVLFSEVRHTDFRITYEKNIIPLDMFDHIKITNKRERFWKSALWGAVVGSAFYVAGQRAAYNEAVSIPDGFPKQGSTGVIEGLSAAGFGFGIGIIVRNFFFGEKKMSIKSQRREIMRKLKDQKIR